MSAHAFEVIRQRCARSNSKNNASECLVLPAFHFIDYSVEPQTVMYVT